MIVSRRRFAQTAAAGLFPAIAFSQHAAVQGDVPPDAVWLNANENPEGPPPAARDALVRAIQEAGRYSHRVFPAVQEGLARSAGVEAGQVILGAGSTEVLHCALDAFTSPARPLITAWPTWEMTVELTAAAGKPVVKVPLMKDWSVDVERMAAEAKKTAGGLIHFGNPNNPTSSVTGRSQVRWLAANLPPQTTMIVDEAYIQFTDPADGITAMDLVREGRNVIVTRTFSKLYGMAGVRAGFGCAPAELVRRMQPYRNNVISVLAARAAMAAIELGDEFVADRRLRRNRIRAEFREWLDSRGVRYIPPLANFILMHAGRDVKDIIPRMLREGVVTGRRFAAMPDWLRLSIGTEAEMAKCRAALDKAFA